MKVAIRINDKKRGLESQEISIEDLIYNQHDIEFEFQEGKNCGILPYSDFLFYQDDYEVIVKVSERK